MLNKDARYSDLEGKMDINTTTLALVAIPLNNHTVAYTVNGYYTEGDKVLHFYAKLFLR